MVMALDPDPESDFQSFSKSGSGFRYSKRWCRNTYSYKTVS